MKLFIYSHLDDNGKPRYQKLEISDSEAEEWVQIDFEERKKKNPDAVIRTAQEIQDSIDREFINSDRTEFRHKAIYQTFIDEDGVEEDIAATIPDTSWTPEQYAIYADYIRIIKENIKKERAEIFIEVALNDEPLKHYAARKGLSYEAAKKLLQRAKAEISKLFSK